LRTTVVVPAYRACGTLPATLAALEPQIAGDPGRELVVVDSTGDRAQEELEARWPWAQFICLPERALPGKARNIGVAAGSGELVAFTDADAVPAADWLDRLEAAVGDGSDVAAGAVENGTPGSWVGTAAHLLEFSEWLPGLRRDLVPHGATCNLIARRAWLDGAGGFREDVFPGEDTILTIPEGRARRLRFVVDARVRHLNRTAPGEFLRHQRRLGEAFVIVCATVPFPHRWVARPALAPLAVLLRLGALARRLRGRDRVRALVVLPLLVLGLCVWARGLVEEGRR
jgi:glycosyltransferase involved in cell wall biosynthesis